MSYYTWYSARERGPEHNGRSKVVRWNDNVADAMSSLSMSEIGDQVNSPADQNDRSSRDDRSYRHSSSHRDGRVGLSEHDNSSRTNSPSARSTAFQSTQFTAIPNRRVGYTTNSPLYQTVGSFMNGSRTSDTRMSFLDDRTQRVVDQFQVRTLPSSAEYHRSHVDYRGFTDAHYIRVARLQQDLCSGRLSGRWQRNERLRVLRDDYYRERVDKGSWRMLDQLDVIVAEDDENLSKGCRDDIPFSSNLSWAYDQESRQPVETTDFALGDYTSSF